MTVTGRLSSFWDKAAPYLVAGLGAFVLILTIDNHVLAQSAANLSQQNLNSQNNHHAATDKKNAQLAQALREANAALADVKESAAVIEYEGGVIAYQNGQIIAAQQQGHATQALQVQMANTQAEFQTQLNDDEATLKTALIAGQAQINTYLHYLTCIGTNPTNTTVCGAAPTLPAT